jgi:anaerobic selenocysteine-containing dehydrogenase
MMTTVHRRKLLTMGTAAATGLLGGGAFVTSGRRLTEADQRRVRKTTGETRRVIPSACWQCVTRCPILGTVDNGRLIKIDGNPASRCTRGRLCARGQAGVNQVDDPDRLLHPLVREGARGEGRWRRISWTEALGLLVEGGEVAGREVRGLRALRDDGSPDKFLFHYGRTVGSDYLILMYYFLPAYGTGSIGDHNSICVAAGGVARALTGGGAGFLDFSRAATILNFGNSMLEAGLDHVPFAQRWVDAVAGGTKLVTFDVRLSNTAARSTEWIPVMPGTDLAVAISHHCGHWAYGRYASGHTKQFHGEDADGRLRWWSDHGAHVNHVIPNRGDPIAGSMCWNDTVVTVSKAPARSA